MRDITELKLFFNEVGDPSNVPMSATEQLERHEYRIAVY